MTNIPFLREQCVLSVSIAEVGDVPMVTQWFHYRLLLAACLFSSAATWALADDNRAINSTNLSQSDASANFTVTDRGEVEDAIHLASAVGRASAADNCGAKSACGCGKGDKCGCEKTKALNKAVAGSHKGVFYDNNFDYLCDPCYTDGHLGDNLKRLAIGDAITLDVGGQYRLRSHHERNIRNLAGVGLGLTGNDDDFLLHRTRVYVNAEVGSRLRVYAEMLDAVSNYENTLPRGVEENRADLQNLFIDAVAMDNYSGTLTARFGRQELLYGNERVVSPLDWTNTRRTFEGVKLLWEGQNWDVDGFWVRPMRRNTVQLDPPNLDREMYGVYSTYKGLPCDKLDLYWLALDFHDAGFLYDTIGARYWGDRGPWLYEFEGAVQFGQNADGSDHSGGAITLGVGRKFDCALWTPTLWLYYDWASGDNTAGNGYHHYQPLAHKYLGLMDLFGRRNIEDANVLLTMQPHEKLKLLLWYHVFRMANINDVPYNVDMSRFAAGTVVPGTAGSQDLGQELDVVATFLINPRVNLLFGYSHFFAGDFYATTPGVPYNGDADFFYTQLHVNF